MIAGSVGDELTAISAALVDLYVAAGDEVERKVQIVIVLA